MAGLVTASNLPEPGEFDYSTSHRSVPVPAPTAYNTTAPVHEDAPASGRPVDREEAASVRSEGRRRGSFSFRRSKSRGPEQRQEEAPPLPATRIAQAQIEAAAAARISTTSNASYQQQQSHRSQPPQREPSNKLRKTSTESSSRGFTMLRKSSRMRKEEQERLARETAAANALPKQPPRLQSINPLPNIGTFGGDEANRPDSYAIFNQRHHSSDFPRAPANFSRPVTNMGSYANQQSSSSPAYAIRSGNAFAQAVSSSPSVAGAAMSTHGEFGYERAESMTNRGRYSYASSTAQVNSVNSPRRVRRRKDPTPFNVLVIGAKNSGKTSFISFLRHSLALPAHKQPYTTDKEGDSQLHASRSSFTSHYLESEMDGERIGVTLWDSAGLEKHIIDLQLREMASFVEAKFEETFVEEQKVVRSPGFRDTHIHCAFLVLDPVRLDNTTASQKNGAGLAKGGLDDDLDLQVLRSLWGKTTVIPVIAKADTLTVGHMSFLKRAVWDSIKSAKLDPLEALELEGEEEQDSDTLPEEDEDADSDGRVLNKLADDSDSTDYDSASEAPAPKTKRPNGHSRQASMAGTIAAANGEELPYLPMSILSPDLYDLPPFANTSKNAKVGRRFPWGFADPYDPEHCDFTRLRDSIFSEWRGDLRDLSRTKWYENWRTSRLKNLPGSKQRVKGGVTPVAAVPREGRTVSPLNIRSEASGISPAQSQANISIPRSVSGTTAIGGQAGGPIGIAVGAPATSKAERVMGFASDAGSMSSRGGVAMHAQ